MTAMFLAIGVIAGTALWPLYRRAQTDRARVPQTFFVAGLAGLVLCTLAGWISGQHVVAAEKAFGFGLLGGAFAVAAILVTVRCLRMGSIASTAVVNNLGLFWPVAVDSLLLRPKGLSLIAISGLVGMAATFVLLGYRAGGGSSSDASLSFLPWLLLLWCLSGMCMSAQAVATFVEPGKATAYMYGSSLTMAGLLAMPWQWPTSRWRPRSSEVVVGAAWGLFYTLGPLMFLQALISLPAVVVYPVAVAGPAVLISLIGPLVYRERLGRYGVAGVSLGIVSLVALAVG